MPAATRSQATWYGAAVATPIGLPEALNSTLAIADATCSGLTDSWMVAGAVAAAPIDSIWSASVGFGGGGFAMATAKASVTAPAPEDMIVRAES